VGPAAQALSRSAQLFAAQLLLTSMAVRPPALARALLNGLEMGMARADLTAWLAAVAGGDVWLDAIHAAENQLILDELGLPAP
jgi:hypothetical protein